MPQDAVPENTEPRRDEQSQEALRRARAVVDIVSDKLASDILLLDIREVSHIADYMVICSVGSDRQANAVLKDLSDWEKALHVEGRADSGWVLLDYGDVIVHVFSPAQRAYYQLEELWSEATPVVRLQ